MYQVYILAQSLILLTFLFLTPQSNGLTLKNQVSKWPITIFRGVTNVDVPEEYVLKKKVCRVVFKSLPKLTLSNLLYSRRFQKPKVRCHWIKMGTKTAISKTIEVPTTVIPTATSTYPSINIRHHVFRI